MYIILIIILYITDYIKEYFKIWLHSEYFGTMGRLLKRCVQTIARQDASRRFVVCKLMPHIFEVVFVTADC